MNNESIEYKPQVILYSHFFCTLLLYVNKSCHEPLWFTGEPVMAAIHFRRSAPRYSDECMGKHLPSLGCLGVPRFRGGCLRPSQRISPSPGSRGKASASLYTLSRVSAVLKYPCRIDVQILGQNLSC